MDAQASLSASEYTASLYPNLKFAIMDIYLMTRNGCRYKKEKE
jgi:hypothetical protein